jgi:hypothetical protein
LPAAPEGSNRCDAGSARVSPGTFSRLAPARDLTSPSTRRPSPGSPRSSPPTSAGGWPAIASCRQGSRCSVRLGPASRCPTRTTADTDQESGHPSVPPGSHVVRCRTMDYPGHPLGQDRLGHLGSGPGTRCPYWVCPYSGLTVLGCLPAAARPCGWSCAGSDPVPLRVARWQSALDPAHPGADAVRASGGLW